MLDESKGGDAIISCDDTIRSLTDLRNRMDVHVAYTRDSPSHHLLKAVGVDFDVPLFRNKEARWRIETNGSKAARETLTKDPELHTSPFLKEKIAAMARIIHRE